MAELSIKRIPIPVYNPQQNGLVERFNRVLAEKLAEAHENKWPIEKTIEDTLFHYRATPHSTTDKSPFEALFGRPMRDTLSLLAPRREEEVTESKEDEEEEVLEITPTVRANENRVPVSSDSPSPTKHTQSKRSLEMEKELEAYNNREMVSSNKIKELKPPAINRLSPPRQQQRPSPTRKPELLIGPMSKGNRQS